MTDEDIKCTVSQLNQLVKQLEKQTLLIEKGLLAVTLEPDDLDYIEVVLTNYMSRFRCDIDEITSRLIKLERLIG